MGTLLRSTGAAALKQLHSLVNPHETIVHIDPVPLPEENAPFLFNPDERLLLLADNEIVNFLHWLVEEAAAVFDRVCVDFDDQAAQQLVELILEVVPFDFANLDGELHNVPFAGCE
jgi:hypothetical protein